MKNIFAFALILTLSNAAFATGGTYCTVDNKDVRISVNLVNGTGFGSAIVPESTVDVTVKNGLVVGLASYKFTKNYKVNEIPYWFKFGKDLKLGAYVEPETDSEGNPIDAFVSLGVVIDTKLKKVDDESTYVGTYTVTQSSNSPSAGALEKELKGKITCTAE